MTPFVFICPGDGHKSHEQLVHGVARLVFPWYCRLNEQLLDRFLRMCGGSLRDIHMSCLAQQPSSEDWFRVLVGICNKRNINFHAHYLAPPAPMPPPSTRDLQSLGLSRLPSGIPAENVSILMMLLQAKQADWLRHFDRVRGGHEKSVLLLRYGLTGMPGDPRWHSQNEVAQTLGLASSGHVFNAEGDATRFLRAIHFYCSMFSV